MPELDQERLKIINQLRSEIAKEDLLTPKQARSFVRGLQVTWEVSTIRWKPPESIAQLDDARRLLAAAAMYRELEGKESPNSFFCYRRAGELMEWLARANDDIETFVPLELLSAAAYQLGGLPAMVSALLGKITADDDLGLRLYSRFFSADFDGAIYVISEFWRSHLDMLGRNAPKLLIQEGGDDNISWYFTVELIRTIGLIAESLRQGDNQRLNL